MCQCFTTRSSKVVSSVDDTDGALKSADEVTSDQLDTTPVKEKFSSERELV